MFVFSFLLIFGVLYLMPSVVAYNRDHRNTASILMLNLFLGWTFVGWVVSLVSRLGIYQRHQGTRAVAYFTLPSRLPAYPDY